MLRDGDLEQMRRDLAEVHADREVSITIRRGTATLGAQSVRITRIANVVGRVYQQGTASMESRGGILVSGGAELDIEREDRFNAGGGLYRVRYVRPERAAGTQAEAELVE